MMNSIVLNPQNRQKSKKAPMDLAIKGFHLRGYPQTNDTWANSTTFVLKINGRERLVNLPMSPFVYPYYFDQPLFVSKNSELEFEYFATAGLLAAVDANPPILVLEYEPIQQVKRSGNTMMRPFRYGPAITHQDFTLYPKYYTRVLSSFCYEDDNAADPVIAYPAMVTTNNFVFKYNIDPTHIVRLVDEGPLEWWRWGQFRRFSTFVVGGVTFNYFPELKRRRYWPGILVRPDMPFFMERVLPVGGLTQGTNVVFEFEYMDENEFKKSMTKR